MEIKCCLLESNIIEIDGTCVCTQCGKVQDMITLGNSINYKHVRSWNSYITEICHRLNIDPTTEAIANDVYTKSLLKHSSLRKNILLATAVYIATKQCEVPRTLKEINSATGMSERKIGEYERIICNKYYSINATHYINRFGIGLGLGYKEINNIKKEIELSFSTTNIQNPVLLCAVYLYKHMTYVPDIACRMRDITGIPISTLKHACKKEFSW